MSTPVIVQWTCLWNSLSLTAKLWSFLMEQSKHLSISLEPHCDNVAQHQLLESVCHFNCRRCQAPWPHSLADNPVRLSRSASHHEERVPGWVPGSVILIYVLRVVPHGFIQALSSRQLSLIWRSALTFPHRFLQFLRMRTEPLMMSVALDVKNLSNFLLILLHLPCLFHYFVLLPTDSLLSHKPTHSYISQMKHQLDATLCRFFISAGSLYMFRAQAPIIRSV